MMGGAGGHYMHAMYVNIHELHCKAAVIQAAPPYPTAMLVGFSCRLTFAQHCPHFIMVVTITIRYTVCYS